MSKRSNSNPLLLSLSAAAFCLFASASASAAAHGSSGNPVLHVGYAYDSCYIDLHPELTAGQFKAFAREFADAGAFVRRVSVCRARSKPS